MRILFLSTKDVNKKNNGGELCTNRNYLSFCELVGIENVTVINLLEVIPSGISNAIKKRINFLLGFYEGMSKTKMLEIIKTANEHDVVFIDSSTQGAIAYHLKRAGYKGKIICFFHNLEANIKQERLKNEPWKLSELLIIKHNEKMACQFSDQIVMVNKRDKEELQKKYNISEAITIPISLSDKYDNSVDGLTNTPPTFVFTGNDWYANNHGITWFIENVLDHVNIKLQITGYKEPKKVFEHSKIEFLGFVDDLPSVLKNADYVLSPIFKGSGMKVKTCEALMYGKNIIGTVESFEGYEIESEKVGACCSTKEEFISSIKDLTSIKREKFNESSRNYFLDKYSFDATLESFKKLV